MNGVYLRALDPDAYADAVVGYLREQGVDWPEERVRAMAPLVQEKVGRLGEFPGVRGLPVRGRRSGSGAPRRAHPRAPRGLRWKGSSRGPRRRSRRPSKQLCEELGEKPRTVFGPIRVAVTGSRVSPGLYESLELLGRDTSLERLRRGAELAA